MVESKREIGSRTAKTGFLNEKKILEKLKNWKNDPDAKKWIEVFLEYHNLKIRDIVAIRFFKSRGGEKSDISMEIKTIRKKIIKSGISLKKQKTTGYNHIGRKNVNDYADKFNFSDDMRIGLLKYCGHMGYSPYELFKKGKLSKNEYIKCKDIPEKKSHSEGTGRYYFYELSSKEQKLILSEFTNKLDQILEYVLRGQGEWRANFMLITLQTDNDEFYYHLETMDETIIRAKGEIWASKRGSIRIGKNITVQRKGGTGGAWQLQFKWKNIFPIEFLEE